MAGSEEDEHTLSGWAFRCGRAAYLQILSKAGVELAAVVEAV